MSDFENSFTADDKFTREYAYSWMWHRQMPWYIMVELTIVFVLGLVLLRFSIDQTDIILAVVCIIMPVLFPVISLVNTKTAIRTSHARSTLLKISSECHTSIHNDQCVVYAKKREDNPTFPLSAVIDHYESRNYFYLVFSGMMVLPFGKTGFSEGTADQFRIMMKKMPKKVNVRAVITGILLIFIIAAVLFVLIHAVQTYKTVGWLLLLIKSMRS